MKPRSLIVRFVMVTMCLVPVVAYAEPVPSTMLLITARSAEFDWTDPFMSLTLLVRTSN